MIYSRHIPLGTSGGNLHVCTHLPTCIHPEYWRRHALSRKDIDTIVAYLPTRMLWLVALGHGILCPWFTLRTSSSTALEVTMSGKSVAIDTMINKLGLALSSTNRLDVDSVESLEHIPPVPRSVIPEADFLRLTSHLTVTLLPRCLLNDTDPIPSIPYIWTYKDMQVVAIGLEGDVVCCNVVIPESDLISPLRGGYTHAAAIGIYEGRVYCLTDEVLLFAAAAAATSN